jgi:hypothetical protein
MVFIKVFIRSTIGLRDFGRAFYSSITNKFPNLFTGNRQIKE